LTNDKLLASLVGGSGIPVKRHGISGLPASADIPVPSFPIAGSHGYNFGGAGINADKITEQELGTDTSGENKADLVDSNDTGANAQTSTIIVCMGGTGTGGVRSNVIQEYSIGTNDNSTDKADLNQTPDQNWTHCYSTTHAYTLGGWYALGLNRPTDMIEEYEFNTTVNATDKADLGTAVGANTGGTDGTYTYSYAGTSYTTTFVDVNMIQAYELGTGTTAVDVADATAIKRAGITTQNTTLLIYNGGYMNVGGRQDVIEEFTMSSTTNATDKADLVTASSIFSGCQTTTHGYTMGGYGVAYPTTEIEEYEFDTTTNAVLKGDLVAANANQFAGGSGTP